jgi:hypothetical protein
MQLKKRGPALELASELLGNAWKSRQAQQSRVRRRRYLGLTPWWSATTVRIPDQRDRLFRANVTGHSGAT